MSTSRLKPLWLHLPTIAGRLRGASALALASDFDGTLTPIVSQPDDAGLTGRTEAVLKRMVRLDRVRLAFLSGRTLEDLSLRLGLEGVFLAGAAGLEIQSESGRRETTLPPGAEVPHALREEMEAWVDRFTGAWLEDKIHSVALHYRHVASGRQGAFGAGVRRRHSRFRKQTQLVHGKKVFEIMPAASRDKAWALERWMSGLPQDAMALYFGDDTNDERALAFLRRRGGVSVAVGRRTSRAEYALESPLSLTWFLEWLEREWIHALAQAQEAKNP